MSSVTVLASFCNLREPTASPILRVQMPLDDKDAQECIPVQLGFPEPISTATGLTRDGERIFVAFGSGGNFHIAALREPDLSLLFFQQTPKVGDPHSILASGNCLYVVSTATDEVLSFDITDNALLNPRVVWKASEAGIDTHHVNSIVEKDGDLLVSAFGPKAGELWSTATHGYIHNISSDKRVMEGIYHPHTLSVHNGEIYYCESHRGWFCSLGGPVFALNGYSRGIGWCSDDLVCVGTSIGRKVSKSTGLLANPADPGEEIGQCALTLRARATGDLVSQIDLSWFGPEIYDVMLLDREMNT